MDKNKQYIICHYDEIGLKGKNRSFFEKILINNIKYAFKKTLNIKVFAKQISGRIIINLNFTQSSSTSSLCAPPSGAHNEYNENSEKIEQTLKQTIEQTLKNVFGLAYFTFAISVEQDMEIIKNKALKILQEKDFKSFRITTKRSKKDFNLTSQQINEQVGAFIVEKLNKRVDLENADIEIYIEIVDNFAFLYTEKFEAQGGLPVGASGKIVSLLSGGIDSPVATYLMLKRGALPILIHFHSTPFTSPTSIEKTKKLTQILNKFYPTNTKLYLIPFAKAQKEIMIKVPEKLRLILYRRVMLRISEQIAKQEKALALVTGDALGQVASQTLENMSVIEEASSLPVLRPLIGFDKKEIIAKAETIGTYKTSILPHEDCCSLFLPKHPETKAKIQEVLEAEKNFDIQKIIQKTLEKTVVERF